jgi:outer membrane protein OmpA-like peptidoglycan-associated protein
MDRTRPSRTARVAAASLAVALTGSAACTSKLESDDASSIAGGETLDAWPELELAGTATTPLYPDVTVDVHAVMRSEDGFTTLFLDVANDGNEDVTVGDLFAYDSVPDITLYDAEANVEYGPLQIDHEFETGGCLCSSSSVAVPPGESTSLHVTYRDVAPEAQAVRVNIGRFTPVDDVPVLDAGTFAVEAEIPTLVEYDRDLSVAVEWVSPTDDGTLVQLRYTNRGRAEPVPLDEFPAPGDLSLVDADGSAIFYPRVADFEPVAGLLGQDDLREGESTTAQVLMARVPDATRAVILRGEGLRRSFPVPVTTPDDTVTPDIVVPPVLDDEEIYSLRSTTWRYDTPAVPTERPDLPPVDEIGAELPSPDVTDVLTSEAQPGWEIGVRAVVQGADHSTLLVDVTNDGAEGLWPAGLGTDDTAANLGGLAVIDPAADKSYGVYRSGREAFSADDDQTPDDGQTVRAYAVLPALEPGSRQVTVDVPTFGRVEGVPVVDGPAAPGDGPVPATMRAAINDRLRMDVLTVSRLGEGNGTLVRTRLVNESDPAAATTPFASWSDDSLCALALTDLTTGDRFLPLAPCQATTWETDLGQGEQLPFEVRFPDLPDDLDDVVVSAAGYLPSPPVAVGEGARPWYLTLPAGADDPEGAVYAGSVGTADGAESTTRTGDTVEVVLAADVLFEFDSADLTADAEARIADLAGRIGDNAAGGTVTITGYTDDVGDDAYNQGLSELRAEAVRAALEPATDRSDLTFEVSGRGEADPVAPNTIDGRDNPDGRQRNRRVTIVYDAA